MSEGASPGPAGSGPQTRSREADIGGGGRMGANPPRYWRRRRSKYGACATTRAGGLLDIAALFEVSVKTVRRA